VHFAQETQVEDVDLEEILHNLTKPLSASRIAKESGLSLCARQIYSDHQNCFNVLKKLLTCHLLTMACIIYYGVLIKVIKRLFLSIGRENHVCKNFICKVIYVNTCDGH
jgi:hypothetical protein